MSDIIWNGKRITASGGVHLITNSVPTPSGIMDYDGNIYTEVTIGSQVWLTQNLKTTHLKDGTPIPNLTTFVPDWEGDTNGAYVWYDDNIGNKNPFGALYNWYVASNHSLNFIDGYHVPSNTEWETLISNVGGTTTAGLVLKESGNSHWTGPNTGASNPFGFTAVGAGFRNAYNTGEYIMIYDRCTFWSTDHVGPMGDAYFTSINANIFNMEVDTIGVSKSEGFTIRLIKN